MVLTTSAGVLLQQGGNGAAAFGAFFMIVMLVSLGIALVSIAGMWKAFQKAGQPGWAAIVPIYNVYVMIKVAGDPPWWLILLFVPFVNFLIAIVVSIHVAEAFGEGVGFGLGLAVLGFVFWPLLGFGEYDYQGAPA
jgi:hypothetical protein